MAIVVCNLHLNKINLNKTFISQHDSNCMISNKFYLLLNKLFYLIDNKILFYYDLLAVSFNCVIKYWFLVKHYSTSHNYIINLHWFWWSVEHIYKTSVIKTMSHLLYFLVFTVKWYFSNRRMATLINTWCLAILPKTQKWNLFWLGILYQSSKIHSKENYYFP